MEITRNEDGSLTSAIVLGRHDAQRAMEAGADGEEAATTRTLHPGQPGYAEALAEWDEQQTGSGEPVTSTSTGRDDAMSIVHAVAVDPDHDVHRAVEALSDPAPGAEALRHVLVGGDPSVKGFAEEVAESEGDDPIPTHQVTKIIGEVLAEIDS